MAVKSRSKTSNRSGVSGAIKTNTFAPSNAADTELASYASNFTKVAPAAARLFVVSFSVRYPARVDTPRSNNARTVAEPVFPVEP